MLVSQHTHSSINFLKFIYRLTKYKGEWRKLFNYPVTVARQFFEVQQLDPTYEKIVTFIVPGKDYSTGKEQISGGVISIFSLWNETSQLFRQKRNHLSLVVTLPKAIPIFKYKNFINNAKIIPLRAILKKYPTDNHIIHVPEYLTEDLLTLLSNSFDSLSSTIHVNILNQNVKLMPEQKAIVRLKKIANLVTITTAHSQYCNRQFRFRYQTPLHMLSVWISPEDYNKVPLEQKKFKIVVSPDGSSIKNSLLEKLEENLPELEVVHIQNLTYERYKKLVESAMFVLTLGEGLDAYFLETVFSGGIGVTIYNDTFFTKKYFGAPGVFTTEMELLKNLPDFLRRARNENDYKLIHESQYKLCSADYNKSVYRKNIAKFYSGEYSYP